MVQLMINLKLIIGIIANINGYELCLIVNILQFLIINRPGETYNIVFQKNLDHYERSNPVSNTIIIYTV